MVFTGIPLISATVFLPSVLWASSLTERFLSLLGMLSLLGTAYTMRHSALHPDRKGKQPISAEDERLAWVRTALLPTNGAVCLTLTAAYFFIGADSSYANRPVLYLIPGGRSLLSLRSLSAGNFLPIFPCTVQPCSRSFCSHEK